MSEIARTARWLGGIVAALTGLLILGVGVTQTMAEHGDPVTATIMKCWTRSFYTNAKYGPQRGRETICDVSWRASGRSHTAPVGFGTREMAVGTQVSVRVRGDGAALPVRRGEPDAILIAGALLLVGGAGGFAVFRPRRQPRTVSRYCPPVSV